MDDFLVWSSSGQDILNVVKGKFILLSNTCTPCKHKDLTAESSVCQMKWQTCYRGSKYSGAFLTCKNTKGILSEPASCWVVDQYLLATDRNKVTFGLDDNSPRENFTKASTHGLLSVSICNLIRDCIIIVWLLLQYLVLQFRKTAMKISIFRNLNKNIQQGLVFPHAWHT